MEDIKTIAVFKAKHKDTGDLFSIRVLDDGTVHGKTAHCNLDMIGPAAQLAGFVYSQAKTAEAFISTNGAPTKENIALLADFVDKTMEAVLPKDDFSYTREQA